MSYIELKSQLHEMIDKVDDPEVLYTVKKMLSCQLVNEEKECLSDEIKNALDQAIDASHKGKVITNQHAKQLTKEKFPNLF